MPPPRILRFACEGRYGLRPSSTSATFFSSFCVLRAAPLPSLRVQHTCLNQFSTTSPAQANWLIPRRKITHKDPKGRPRMPTGGSVRGTTVIWGDYGLRMRDHDRRISAKQLKIGEDVIRRRLRGMNFRLFMRVHPNTAVYKKGNETRMGTGKGSFDHWAARVAVSRIVFELSADIHEQIVRDAFRLAAAKMPGLYEFVKKNDPPVMGITKLSSEITAADLKRPRRKTEGDIKAERLPAADTVLP